MPGVYETISFSGAAAVCHEYSAKTADIKTEKEYIFLANVNLWLLSVDDGHYGYYLCVVQLLSRLDRFR
jgi:hypothetical protein